MPSYFTTYLETKHALFLRLKTCKEIAWVVRTIKGLVEREDEVVYLIVRLEPVLYLPIQSNRFKYTTQKLDSLLYSYIYYRLENIQRHYYNNYRQKNTWKRGQLTKREQEKEVRKMWVKGVCCQQFNKAGSLGQLFKVQPLDMG